MELRGWSKQAGKCRRAEAPFPGCTARVETSESCESRLGIAVESGGQGGGSEEHMEWHVGRKGLNRKCPEATLACSTVVPARTILSGNGKHNRKRHSLLHTTFYGARLTSMSCWTLSVHCSLFDGKSNTMNQTWEMPSLALRGIE